MPPSENQKQLDRIENAIIGNGHEGLLARTARIEENIESISKDVGEAKEIARNSSKKSEEMCAKTMDAVDSLALNLTELKKDVGYHHATEHLATLVKKKEFWMIVIATFVTLHLISTYVPNAWDWVVRLVGLPSLLIPLN